MQYFVQKASSEINSLLSTALLVAALVVTISSRAGRVSESTETTTFDGVGGIADARSSSVPASASPLGYRLFSADSPFNTPIPSGATADPSSAALVDSLVSDAKRNDATITWAAWSVPVYWADSTTPRYTITFDRFSNGGYHRLVGVPIPAQARPAAPDTCTKDASDGHMTIIDKTNNCMYDFFEACKKPDGSWTASWANSMYSTGAGVYAEGASCRGSGFANLAGLITPADFTVRVIKHALLFSTGVNRAGGPVFPATESDGRLHGAQYVPEGAHVRLKASFDLSGYPAWLQIIGQALKTYGAYDGDNSGGGFTLYAVDANRSDLPWRGIYPWGNTKHPSIPIEFIQNLEVLTLGAQTASQHTPLLQSCAQYER